MHAYDLEDYQTKYDGGESMRHWEEQRIEHISNMIKVQNRTIEGIPLVMTVLPVSLRRTLISIAICLNTRHGIEKSM